MKNLRFLFLALMLATLALSGCVTAPGATFATLEPVPPGKANLYIYRKAAIYAFGAKYAVADEHKRKLGELYNASYVLIPVEPGKRVFSVDEGFGSPKSFELTAEAGKTYFVEYDSSKGLLLGLGLLSGSAVRSQEQALIDLKELKRAN